MWYTILESPHWENLSHKKGLIFRCFFSSCMYSFVMTLLTVYQISLVPLVHCHFGWTLKFAWALMWDMVLFTNKLFAKYFDAEKTNWTLFKSNSHCRHSTEIMAEMGKFFLSLQRKKTKLLYFETKKLQFKVSLAKELVLPWIQTWLKFNSKTPPPMLS